MAILHSPSFTSLTGWRRRGLAALLGVLAAGALPPVFLLPLLIPSFAGLFLLTLNASRAKQAFFDGWWWGLGHFTAGLYWISISLYVEPEKFAWLTPFALFGLPSILAIYIGIVTWLLYQLHKKWPALRPATLIMFFAAFWLKSELARSQYFSGFPWNLIGYAWNMSDTTLQTASIWGIYGQSWLIVVLATLPALFLIKDEQPALMALAGASAFIAVIVFGALRLANHPTEYTDTQLRIVQGNIAQSMKFNPETAMEGLRKHADLTKLPGREKADAVIWPETAVPYILAPKSPLMRELGNLLPEKTLLITGGMRGEGDKENWQAWNSLFVINAAGELVTHYDKYHLVPFGEYIPFRHILPLDNIAGGMGDFSTGPAPATLMPGQLLAFSPLICYEAIFPGKATDGSGRAKWLVNVTNDAWFGVSSGPYQHLEMARVRSVEEGLPLIRAANTGISAIYDAYGRLLKQLPIGEEGIIDSNLPVSVDNESIKNRTQNNIILLMVVASFCISFINNRVRPKKII